MELFDKLTVKMKSHIWCVIFFSALMIFWIVAFSVSGKGDNIASWVSILFAVVVIVYMLIQGHEMRNLVEEGHRLMAEKTGKVAESAKSISERLSEFLQFREPPPSKISEIQPLRTRKLHINVDTRIVTVLVLYACAQSCKFDKQMSLKKVGAIILHAFEMTKIDDTALSLSAWANIGILFGVESFLEPVRVITGENIWDAKVENLPPDFEELIVEELTRRATKKPVSSKYADKIDSAKRNIDAYFAEL